MHTFSFPTLIQFGAGVRSKLPEFLQAKGISRPLLVTDKGLAPLPACKDVEALLNSKGLKSATFSGIWGNPVKSQVDAGVSAYHEHKADAIVGMGGGAALDVAKAIAVMVHHTGDLFDYEDGKPGGRPIDQKLPLWIAVPTTSGTGSEVGRSSVISDEKTHIKKFIFTPRLMAHAVFADPELTYGLPAPVTAATGMDALTHCVEAYLAKDYHPICDGVALEGLRLAAHHLPIAVKEPKNSAARGAMMMCSIMGGIAFQKGLGVTHSCAHALGTAVDMHHGLANAIMIDFALKINKDVARERFEIMSDIVGTPFLQWVRGLKETIGIPMNLSKAGVSKEQLGKFVDLAYADSCHQNNPRPVSKEDFRAIFTEAF